MENNEKCVFSFLVETWLATWATIPTKKAAVASQVSNCNRGNYKATKKAPSCKSMGNLQLGQLHLEKKPELWVENRLETKATIKLRKSPRVSSQGLTCNWGNYTTKKGPQLLVEYWLATVAHTKFTKSPPSCESRVDLQLGQLPKTYDQSPVACR